MNRFGQLKSRVAAYAMAVLVMAQAQGPAEAQGFDKVNTTVMNVNAILVTISIAVVTIAIIWAGFKMAPSPGDGGCGGSAVGRPAHRLPLHGRRSFSRRCDNSPGAAPAAKAHASLEQRRPRGRRDTKRSDWRDGRAAAITSGAARLRAWQVTEVAIWPAQRAAQSIRTGLFANRAFHAQRE